MAFSFVCEAFCYLKMMGKFGLKMGKIGLKMDKFGRLVTSDHAAIAAMTFLLAGKFV